MSELLHSGGFVVQSCATLIALEASLKQALLVLDALAYVVSTLGQLCCFH